MVPMTNYTYAFLYPSYKRADGGTMPNTGNWQTRHTNALRMPVGVESPMVGMISAWTRYADVHSERYERSIGQDSFLGPAWAVMGRGIRTILNGDCGRLDIGILDKFIVDTLMAEGFDP